ncbi:MAG: hypothetical protein IJT41_10135 [Clostridia bacterium]|nr:hypothetical protein [Clostridia bacterium]
MHTFDSLRRTYPVFAYDSYSITCVPEGVRLSFDFSIDGLCAFHPQTIIYTNDLPVCNAFDAPAAQAIVYALGLVEAVSYYKAACPPVFEVRCGNLTGAQKRWWKKLWYNGLGEFFFRNGIETSEADFTQIRCPENYRTPECDFRASGAHIVPIGGGKDSAVTLSLLQKEIDHIYGFTVNDQPARTDTAKAAGLPLTRVIRTRRTIDPELLRLNREGFLNGHTPFSAIVAFLSLYCAYLIGAENIVLSNESSANESTVAGSDVNHQYSKSYTFERDFTDYVRDYIGLPTRYFSLLRPFNEMQIARQFAALPQYHAVFRSCNAGSKQNIWCGKCAKCLFVYSILSPFLSEEALRGIFGENLLDKASLQADFDGLCGIADVKPFECIGTVHEVQCALCRTAAQYTAQGKPLPVLLQRFMDTHPSPAGDPLTAFNDEHNVPQAFIPYIEEMARYVRSDSLS